MNTRIIVNELLAYIQQSLTEMDDATTISICKSRFSKEDIFIARILLYEVINKRHLMDHYKRHKSKKSLEDIITLLKVTSPDHLPSFVPTNWDDFPLNANHIYITCLLKNLVDMKSDVLDLQAKFEMSQRTVTELQKRVDMLSDISCVDKYRGITTEKFHSFSSISCIDTNSCVQPSREGSVYERRPIVRPNKPPPPPPPQSSWRTSFKSYQTIDLRDMYDKESFSNDLSFLTKEIKDDPHKSSYRSLTIRLHNASLTNIP